MKQKAKFLYLILAISLLMTLIVCQAKALEPYYSGSSLHDVLREQYPDGLPWATINAYDVNFREGPGKQYRALFHWSYGVAVEVLGEHDGWFQVLHWSYKDPVWVWGEYLDMVER